MRLHSWHENVDPRANMFYIEQYLKLTVFQCIVISLLHFGCNFLSCLHKFVTESEKQVNEEV